MEIKIENSWKEILSEEFNKDYFLSLVEFVRNEYSKYTCYPKGKYIFNAFEQTPFDKVKVVLLGQDPYHGVGQANGLCFSVNKGIQLPPSLKNIFQELKNDIGIDKFDGDLTSWANQGVLLLNTTLTVRESNAGSHQGNGWEVFTDEIIKKISDKKSNIVFILWGGFAQKKEILIDTNKHKIIKSVHPSPLSVYRGFFGSKPFSKTNEYLISKNINPINW